MDRFRASSLIALLALAGCATPSTQAPVVAASDAAAEGRRQAAYALQTRMAEHERVQRVAYRLMTANLDVCPVKGPRLGMEVLSAYDLGSAWRPAVREGLSVGGAPELVFVAPDGPAAKAGLVKGDVIVEVAGRPVGAGAHGATELRTALAAAAAKPFALAYLRDGVRRTAEVTPQQACAYPVHVAESDAINAYADGAGIFVTRGLLKLAVTDEELAVVLGHEMAHDTERHIGAKRRNAALGMGGGLALDILAAAAGVNTGGAFMKAGGQSGQGYASPAFEAEADYVGLYYVARAGYDISDAEQFWRKMSVEAPRSIFVTTSHPANAQRYLALAATRREIEAKRATKLALLPTRKTPAPDAAASASPLATATALAAAPKSP